MYTLTRVSFPRNLIFCPVNYGKIYTHVVAHSFWFVCVCSNVLFFSLCAAWQFETPQQVQFVEKLSDVVIGQLPNFWKLWISYVNGSLFSEVNNKTN